MSEKDVENSILEFLNMQPGCFCFKVETQGQFDARIGGFRKRGRFVIKGTSDIIGIYLGHFVCIEVKSGPDKKPSREQEAFINRVRKLGGYGCVAWSIEQARELLNGIVDGTSQKRDGTGSEISGMA